MVASKHSHVVTVMTLALRISMQCLPVPHTVCTVQHRSSLGAVPDWTNPAAVQAVNLGPWPNAGGVSVV